MPKVASDSISITLAFSASRSLDRRGLRPRRRGGTGARRQNTANGDDEAGMDTSTRMDVRQS